MESRSVLLPLLLVLGTVFWATRTFIPQLSAATAAETSVAALRGSADLAALSASAFGAIAEQDVLGSSMATAAADPLWWLPITLGLGVFTAISTFGLFWFLTDGFDPDRRDTGRR
mmetsp:Transcript_60921/g.145181  ORF Transcript_60921/g.145181 Transcript_60921/m.145181 type:complete len:115 (+) Transcript_60921:76-420(+)|eukprot:CAMPEP_0178401338 /NCGR_PEP_ID=MMETSP0689_2-20121128/16251_1 /TAXON_ID=160604 /ORGANISM="Amphidinium massartii, Strain CS-259" /LENGTH=114 /DNA_ID=CAMNT_0020022157 /DNA_START=76 /DNA_END=420 /DNA_ORIENTATION=-